MRRRAWPLDAAIAVGVAALTIWSVEIARGPGDPPLSAAGLGLLLLQTLPLAARRRAPVVVWFVIGVGAFVYGVGEHTDPLFDLGPILAVYTVAALTDRRTADVAGLVTAATIVLAVWMAGDSDVEDILQVLLFALAWVAGRQVADVGRERDRAAAEAVAQERARIARELHDVVAHHVGMIVVQAEAGAAVASGPPEQASFEAIAATGREAMVEMRRLLGVLHDESAPERSPQPGLSRLPELVEQVRRAGLPVEVHVEGEPCILPAGVDLTAYRVVQEALTNTLRHGAGAAATVSVRYSPDAVVVDVTDDNAITRATGQRETGRGLIGMRERVALCGGELEAGPRPEGGFRVRARLPR